MEADGKLNDLWVIIIETKGEGFASKFVPRKQFMEESFIKLNNDKIGYNRFEFLYIEDTDGEPIRLQKQYEQLKTSY